MTQFKVGDRVRLTGLSWGESGHSGAPNIGETVTISAINSNGDPVFNYYEGDEDLPLDDLLNIEDPDWSAELVEAQPNRTYYETKVQLDGAKIASNTERLYDAEKGVWVPDSFEQNVHRILNGVAETVVQKNVSYGDSALNPIRVFSKSGRMEQLFVRLDDKLSRVQRGSEYPGDDTLRDIIGYCTLILIARGSE